MKLFFGTMKLFSHNETNLGHDEIILLRKVSFYLVSVKKQMGLSLLTSTLMWSILIR